MADRREYISWYVVRISHGQLVPVHPGAIPFYDDALTLQQLLGISTAIIDENTWSAYEDANAQSICECQTECVMDRDINGSFWRCPSCGNHV